MPQYPVPGGNGASQEHKYYSSPEKYGEYQFINLQEIINNFMAAYVGEGKIIANALKSDVSYHANRALQELKYDTLTSCKSQEIILPPSLTMRLPHDYVNYTKITRVGSNGIERVLYPTSKTSKGNKIQQDDDGNYLFTSKSPSGAPKLLENNSPLSSDLAITPGTFLPNQDKFEVKYTVSEGYNIVSGNVAPAPASGSIFLIGMEIQNPAFPPGTTIVDVVHSVNPDLSTNATIFTSNDSINFPAAFNIPNNRVFAVIDNSTGTTWGKYKASNQTQVGVGHGFQNSPAADNDQYFTNFGQRYGLDAQHAQINGSFYMDCEKGLIHFSSNLSGQSIILHYLSDGQGTAGELIVHKLAEEAVYKHIAYGCASARVDIPEGIIQRLKKERFAETRKAKLRLSNIKLEEITQIMRGKTKFIQH